MTRLRREVLESAMVVIGWLPRPSVSRCIHIYSVLVAPNSEQPKINNV
jgi:hypothetical protein